MPINSVGMLLNCFIYYLVGFTLGAFGSLYSEKSGIINIAIEGGMVVGGFSGIIFINSMAGVFPGSEGVWITSTRAGVELLYFIGCLIAIAASILFSFLLSFVSIKLKANQTVVGTALNTVAVAVGAIINTILTGKDTVEIENNVFSTILLVDRNMGDFAFYSFSNLHCGVIIGIIAIVVLWLAIDRTRFGLRLKACGENPAAADSVGINVSKMRYLGTMIGTAAAGLGGFILFTCMSTAVWTIDAFGFGFIVIAIEILGNWKTLPIFFGTVFFAFFFSFSRVFPSLLSLPQYSGLPGVLKTQAIYSVIPYLLAFIALMGISKKSRAPKAEGIPYDKASRS